LQERFYIKNYRNEVTLAQKSINVFRKHAFHSLKDRLREAILYNISLDRFSNEEADNIERSVVNLKEVQRGVNQFLLMGYSNTICKKEPGELTQWALNKDGTTDIETYYE